MALLADFTNLVKNSAITATQTSMELGGRKGGKLPLLTQARDVAAASENAVLVSGDHPTAGNFLKNNTAAARDIHEIILANYTQTSGQLANGVDLAVQSTEVADAKRPVTPRATGSSLDTPGV